MGDQVGSAPVCYGISLGSNTDIPQEDKISDISKEAANTLWPAKNKKIKESVCFFEITH
jgi:hypothetical protein